MNTPHARSHRNVGLVGLVAGPVSLIATTLIQWTAQPSGPSPTIVDVVNQYPAAWLAATLFAVFGPMLWIAGLPAAIGVARDRGWALTATGGYLTGIGLAAAVGHLALYFGLAGVIASSGVDDATAQTLAQAGDEELLGNLLLVVFLACFSLGPILLAIGLRRAGVVPVWVPVAAIVMTVANFVGGPVAGIVQLCALVLTFGPIIVAVWRSPDVASGRASRSAVTESAAI